MAEIEVLGKDLQVGDHLVLYSDTIASIKEYEGPLARHFPQGVSLIEFVTRKVGTSVDKGALYAVKRPGVTLALGPWTDEDHKLAFEEGWGIFNDSEIQRFDDENKFDNDAQAVDFVVILAGLGHSHAQKALAIHLQHMREVTTERVKNTDDKKYKARMRPYL